MKKILLTIFIFTCLLYSTSAFASFDILPPNIDPPAYFSSNEIGSLSNLWQGYYMKIMSPAPTSSGQFVYVSLEDQDHICIAGCSGTPWNSFIISNYVGTPTPPVATGIFYGRDETGSSTANELVAMVGNASGKTMETMGGIVGTIGGIIFAFGFIMYIRSIINEANIEKKRKDKGL